MFSSSFDSRLLRPIHANVRSTIHRFGSTAKRCRSEHFTISICHGPNALTAAVVAVLNVGWVDDEVEHQAERVDTDVPQRASDFLDCVVAGRIHTGPPLSALLTLWLSIMAAVGLASCFACLRMATQSA